MKIQGSTPRGGCIPLLIIAVLLIFIPIGFMLGRDTVASRLAETALAQMPTVTPTPDSVVWTGQSLIAGLNLVYAETDLDRDTATIWVAPVKNLSLRKQIAVLAHASNRPIDGLASPDSSEIALVRFPPGTPASVDQGPASELWLAKSDGRQPFRVASQAAFLGGWSPDGRRLVFARRNSDPAPTHIELRQYDAEKGKTSSLLNDPRFLNLQPLGWNPTDGHFYLATVSKAGQWTVLDIDPDSLQVDTRLELPIDQGVRNLSLSPAGGQLLVEIDQGEQTLLAAISLDGSTQQLLASAPGQASGDPFNALWAPDGKGLILRHLPDGSPIQFDQIDLANRQVKPLAFDPTSTAPALVPLSWSPDGAWLVLQPPAAVSEPILYLQEIDSGKLVIFPRSSASKVLSFLGWVEK